MEAKDEHVFDPQDFDGFIPKLQVVLGEGATQPHLTSGSEAHVLYAAESATVGPYQSTLVHTNIKLRLPIIDGRRTVGMIMTHTGIGDQSPVEVIPRIVEFTHHGFVPIILRNLTPSDASVAAGDIIAKLLIMPAYAAGVSVVDSLE